MKYVMFRKRSQGLVSFTPIIFPEDETHSEIANAIIAGTHLEAVSAGFLYCKHPSVWECFGASESMKLASHADDSTIINMGPAARFMHDEREGCKVYGK